MSSTESAVQHEQEQARAVTKIEQALGMIATGLVHRDRQIRTAILSELAGTTIRADLQKKPLELLIQIAETIRAIGQQLRDGMAFETLLDLQSEARRLFDRIR